ncbi:MAG TPA: glycosyl hydrolase family 8 [Longimicrobium sp.]|jgi:endo-1,4-beta-D-glucanase Y
MHYRHIVPAALALVAALSACQDGELMGPAMRGGPPAAPRLLASGASSNYAYTCHRSIAPNQATANQRLDELYADWKTKYVRTAGAGKRVLATMNADTSRTFSEGQGYGMLLAAYFGDKPVFDGLWAYAKSYSNPARGHTLMPWEILSNGTVPGAGDFATDGDEDIAFALLVADFRWGGYKTDATALINALLTYGVEADNTINAGPWATNDDVNPSYFDPAYYKAFAIYTGNSRWNDVAARSHVVLNNIETFKAGRRLLPDWSTVSGDTAVHRDSAQDHRYGYDAVRVPWRMAKDAVWNCDPDARARLDRMNALWTEKGGVSGIRDEYTLEGAEVNPTWHSDTFNAMAAAGSIVSPNRTFVEAFYTDAADVPSWDVGYFPDHLRLLGLLLATGNMPHPFYTLVESFESGQMTGWRGYAGTGSTATATVVAPGGRSSRYAVKLDYAISSYGGLIREYTTSQDWRYHAGIRFRFKGSGTGNWIQVELQDNRGPDPITGASETFIWGFTDNQTTWREITIPWTAFTRNSWQATGAPNDGLTLSQVWGLAFTPGGTGSFQVDEVALTKW